MLSARPERDRRPAGWLRTEICRVLETAERPVSGQALAMRLNSNGHKVYHSAVFRALNRLRAEGAVRKIELTAGYVISRGEAVLYLVCMQCRRVTERCEAVVMADLDRVAAEQGFQPRCAIVEVAGTCLNCVVPRTNRSDAEARSEMMPCQA